MTRKCTFIIVKMIPTEPNVAALVGVTVEISFTRVRPSMAIFNAERVVS